MDDQIVLVMTIEVSPGVNGLINVHYDDTPDALAKEFGAFYNLDKTLINSLSRLIKRNKDAAIAKLNNKDWMKWQSDASKRSQFRAQDSVDGNIAIPRQVGERLYLKGQVYSNLKNQRISSAQEQQQQKEKSEHTFKPKLNPAPNHLKPKRLKRKIEEHLLEYKKKQRQKFEDEKTNIIKRDMSDCSFQPQISKRSQMLDSLHDNSTNRHEELYMDAVFRKERKEQLTEAVLSSIYSFQPNLGHNRPPDRASAETLPDRLVQQKKEQQEKLEKTRESLWTGVDEKTGQQLFKPVVGREPSVRNKGKTPVWEYLYSMRNARSPQASIQQQSFDKKQKSKKDAVYESYKLNRYNVLFQILDSDSDGLISPNGISIDNIHSDTVEAMLPVLEHIQGNNLSLNFDDFVKLMEELVKSLPMNKKNHIFKSQRKVESNKELKFKPDICNNTVEIVRSKQEIQGDIYQRMMHHIKNKEQKLKESRYVQQVKEIQECSFAPKTVKYDRAKFSYQFNLSDI